MRKSLYIYIYIQILNKELGYRFSFPIYFTIKEHPDVLMALKTKKPWLYAITRSLINFEKIMVMNLNFFFKF
jgi:hypothetical protein